jgi:lysophospholipase L1-like esterase
MTASGDALVRTPANFDFGSNDALRVTAFGDSITRGVLDDDDGRVITTGNNYPANLELGLRTLDPGWRVINRGLAGERTSEGRRRLPGVLLRDRPGFVLVMEGTNDASMDEDPAFILANLDAMVAAAQGNRSVPVIGTIPPNFRSASPARSIVPATNTLIRSMANARRVVLAEIFDGMNDASLFGSPDPLHPNETGYVRMAGIWFDAMQRAIPSARSRRNAAPEPDAAPPPSLEVGQARARRRP